MTEERQMNKTERYHFYKLVVGILGAWVLIGVNAASADERRRGFYIGAELGIADLSSTDISTTGVNHPTKCDSFLYPDPGLVPSSSPECNDNTPKTFSSNTYNPGIGFAGGFNAGYAFGSVRFELEHLSRFHEDRSYLLLVSADNVALAGKNDEWNPNDLPSGNISDFDSHQLFLNAYYDFRSNSPWTFYVGAGAGWARTSFNVSNRYTRKTLAQGYQDVEPPLTVADRPAAAAGTLSLLDTGITEYLFGFQALAGVDYALTEKTSIVLKARWSRFEDLSDDATWNLLRSHEPIQADGVTPFTTTQALDNIDYWGITLGLRYHF